MNNIIPVVTGLFSLTCWLLFGYTFSRDRSRYRNCYLLFLALLSMFPFVINIAGRHGNLVAVIIVDTVIFLLLLVPFFLIYNGIVMMIKEGRKLSHALSLSLGIAIFIGETLVIVFAILYSVTYDSEKFKTIYRTMWFIAGAAFTFTVIYISLSFLMFMIYTLFLQIVPRQRDFDYVIIHGAGLLKGDRISRLLEDRLNKAIDIYRLDPTPPKLIPSGGQGIDETVSEAEAMKKYLLEHEIPESDIILEDKSRTTLENLKFSKQILDAQEGRKYTALVTSNYHVYRALRYCHKIGLSCTGIGSRVAFYYWPSALIREFIAIHAEKKHAVIFVVGWMISMIPVWLMAAR
ncbi:MAG: YdcF family protein [Lachnospiraceae bacterium]|nr:YdcF family protein [Lachnospiraceae bacterium]